MLTSGSKIPALTTTGVSSSIPYPTPSTAPPISSAGIHSTSNPVHIPSSRTTNSGGTYIKPPDRNQCLWIRWCAFHYVLPFCSFCLLAITPPPAGHQRVALSISAPVNKNHCAFHPSAITIAISACAFQSVHSTHRQSTVAISACVSNIRVSTHSSLCVRTCAFYFYTSERKSFLQSTQSPKPDRNQCLWIPWCAFHYVLPFCSFCLLAITPMQSVPVCPTPVSETTIQSVLHLSAITELRFLFLHQ